MRRILVALTCLLPLGCSSVLDADANGIWIKESLLGVGNTDAEASEHCQKYGKRAEYQSTLEDTGSVKYMMPIRAYKCVQSP